MDDGAFTRTIWHVLTVLMEKGWNFYYSSMRRELHLRVHLLQAPADEELQYGDDVARVGGHSAPEALDLMWERPSMLQGDVVHALQQRLTPVACREGVFMHSLRQ